LSEVTRGIVQILCKLLQTILYTLQTSLYSYTTTIVVRLEQALNSGAYTTTIVTRAKRSAITTTQSHVVTLKVKTFFCV
jgi:hypothetical protein